MRSQSQILMIALAISFAMALALTVALICISYIKESPADFDMTVEELTETQADVLDTLPPPMLTDEESEENTEAPDEPYLSNGLRFTSNGDGTCVLSGIGTCTDACVVIPEYAPNGERVTEVAAMALYGCTTVSAIQIPASVCRIGNLAFAACSELAYISVSDSNSAYCDVDGVLYTSELSKLIQYPPMRMGSTALIRTATAEISDMAFYGCAYLTRIVYTGTPEEWEQIRIGSKNYSLTAAAKTFEGGK